MAYSSECGAAGNALAGWVGIDLPGVVSVRGVSQRVHGRGFHSSTFQLNLSAFCSMGGVFKGCLGGVWGLCRGHYRVLQGV